MTAAPRITVIDCETTGLDRNAHRVVEVAALKLDDHLQVRDRFTSLVDPSCPLPLQTSRLTGISDADLLAAASAKDVWPALAEFVGEDVLVGHNVGFDAGFLTAECLRAGAEPPDCGTFDTLEASILLFPELDRHGLDRLAAALGLAAPAHRAEPDAEATAQLLVALCRRARELPERERRLLRSAGWQALEFLDRFAQASAVQAWHEPGALAPDGAEPGAGEGAGGTRESAGRGAAGPGGAGESGDGRGAAGSHPGGGDQDRRSGDGDGPPRIPADPDAWRTAFAPGGAVADHLPGYRVRPGQMDLAGSVAGLMERGGVGVFEAGTGMGKSLAYLLPAAARAASSGTRVLISTKTKALQRQLAASELPLTARAVPGLRWAVLMGRENYLCERALREACAAPSSTVGDPGRLLALAYLSGRSRRTEVDLSGLPYGAGLALPELAETAASLRSSTARCARRACHVRSRCHWRLARARAAGAHLVCVNHALLLAGAGLPYHEDVVIDEAHLLPDEAQAAFSRTADRALLAEILRELAPRRARSFAAQLRAAAGSLPPEDRPALLAAADEIQDAADDLSLREGELAAALQRLMATDAAPDDGYDRSLWLRAGLSEAPVWDAFAGACHELAEALSAISTGAGVAAALLPEETHEAGSARALADRAGDAARTLEDVLETGTAESVAWATVRAPQGGRAPRRRRGRAAQASLTLSDGLAAESSGAARAAAGPGLPFWSLTRAPLSPAPGVRAALWERLRSAVLVSATLTVRGSFEYFDRQTGLTADLEPLQDVFPSPFDYRDQAVMVVEHAPEREYSPADAVVHQTRRLRDLTEATGGRLLALFTNKQQMNQVAGAIGERAQSDGVLLLAQGLHGSAASLADEFRAHPATVLLGVDALWTGQDFPGDTLVCLVIAKLPFPRQDPLFQARREAAQQDGHDWFRDFYLPEAVLRFRQGFGRLIRTETDRGVVVVLDHRLTQKRYFGDFLQSLPEIEVVRARPEDVATAAAAALRRLGCLT